MVSFTFRPPYSRRMRYWHHERVDWADASDGVGVKANKTMPFPAKNRTSVIAERTEFWEGINRAVKLGILRSIWAVAS